MIQWLTYRRRDLCDMILVEFHRFFLIACIHMYTCLLAARWMMRIQMVSHMLSKQTDLGFWWILLQPRNLRIVISSNSLVHGKMNLGENFNQDLCIELPRVWQQRFQREGISLSFSLARSLARTTYNWHLCLRVLTEKYIFLHTQWHTRLQFDDRACVCTHTLSFCFFLSLSLSLTHTHTHTHAYADMPQSSGLIIMQETMKHLLSKRRKKNYFNFLKKTRTRSSIARRNSYLKQ